MKKTACIALASFIFALSHQASATEKLSLMLDWFPNVDHLPIYVARDNGFFREAGLEVKILSPSETSDALKLAIAGTVDLAVGYEPQTVIAAAEGLSPKVIGRLVGHPLCTLLYMDGSGIAVPKDLEGKTIGYTVPGLMDTLLAAFARENGIQKYEPVNVGFTIVPALASGKVDAVMGPFKTYEVVDMQHKGLKTGYFELEKHGIPDYDELIFVTSATTATAKSTAIQAFADAVQRGINWVREDPQAALEIYFKALPEADRVVETDAFQATLPYFVKTQTSDPKRWQTFIDFAKATDLIDSHTAVTAQDLLSR